MKCKRLFVFAALAACIGTAGAQGASGRISFVGQIVQGTCNASQLQLGREGGKSCSNAARRVIDTERMAPAPSATDSAMLDYFLERTKGGAKFVLTRQYR